MSLQILYLSLCLVSQTCVKLHIAITDFKDLMIIYIYIKIRKIVILNLLHIVNVELDFFLKFDHLRIRTCMKMLVF